MTDNLPDKKEYSTGFVSGLTGIPITTMQRYVRDYRPHFSDHARKPNRGRRFTSQDIHTLTTIRHLYQDKCKKDYIESVLSGEQSPPAVPRYDLDNVIECVAIVEQSVKQALATAQRIRFADNDRHLIYQLRREINELKGEVRYIRKRMQDLTGFTY